MRTFHTNTTVCGYSQKDMVGAVGRLQPSSENLHMHTCTSSGTEGIGSFRVSSRHDVMKKSLLDGITYFGMQLKGLSKSESIIKEISRICAKGSLPINIPDKSAREFLLDTLTVVTSEEFRTQKLFGFGHESPLRLHLNIKNKRKMYPLPVVPLLGKPAFRSLGLTLGIGEDVSTKICHDSLQEIITLMLEVQDRKDELTKLSKQVSDQVSSLSHSSKIRRRRLPEFFKNMRSRIYKQSKLILPRPLPEVPI